MPSRFVVQPNGFLARFSTIVEDFTHLNLTDEEAVQVGVERAIEDAKRDAKDAIQNARSQAGTDWADCLRTVRLVHGADVAEKREKDIQ